MTYERLNAPPPRARLMAHPGPFEPVRIERLHAQTGRHVRLTLEPGQTLYDGIVIPLSRLGISSASMTILGGYTESLDYCVTTPDPSKRSVIVYTKPIQVRQAYFIFGNATLGLSSKGAPLVHCHAALRTAQGDIQGGHIITEATIVGPAPISVLVTSFAGVELRQTYDPEINLSVLKPHKEP